MVSRLLVTLDVGDMRAVSVPLPETTQDEHDVEVEEGVTVHVKVAKRSASAPWLVFVNSLLTNQKMWDDVLPRLSRKYNLITYDQRGHGKVGFCFTLRSYRYFSLTIYENTFPVICSPKENDSRDPLRRHCHHSHEAFHSNPYSRRDRRLARRSHDSRFRPQARRPHFPLRCLRYSSYFAHGQRQSVGRSARPR